MARTSSRAGSDSRPPYLSGERQSWERGNVDALLQGSRGNVEFGEADKKWLTISRRRQQEKKKLKEKKTNATWIAVL
ncbi:hypothetical protein OsI_14891 [Oryza sativa Indica Group]|uniref:Uncharacterized protein n=1 Tax=Oryza sativa subsp. indica TaxID=39946 RepID=A2XQI0_ORYSI|nr:hypothetical protein OsI_14891 [Oryza sativa Indica Group]